MIKCSGKSVLKGIAIGRIYLYKKQEYVLKQETIENPEAEIERMEKAKELLENTTLKNYEIAEKVGFSDPHYFGISFKKMTGKTPTEYAREKRR